MGTLPVTAETMGPLGVAEKKGDRDVKRYSAFTTYACGLPMSSRHNPASRRPITGVQEKHLDSWHGTPAAQVSGI